MKKRTVIGSGIYNLDVIVERSYPDWPQMRPFVERTVIEEAGGTCGNVMCMLSRKGWDARPQACLDDSPQGLKIREDLLHFGCDCRHVTNTPAGGTTILWCTHKKNSDGEHVMSARAGSPGGSRFPRRHFLRARDEAPDFLSSLETTPDVYFFDDPAAGHRLVAGSLRERGALVWFEPSGVGTRQDLGAVGVSDIVKFSDQNVPDVSFTDAWPDRLFIQTLGAEGVRFRLRGGEWVRLPAVPCDRVVDWEGAGDTLTAAFLTELYREVPAGCRPELTEERIRRVLEAAQREASRSVGFLGSKGMFRAEED